MAVPHWGEGVAEDGGLGGVVVEEEALGVGEVEEGEGLLGAPEEAGF
jgi:hypothetical protein